MVACEIQDAARKELISNLSRDPQARVVDLDGWTALTAYVPPNERRGLVLIDPPFEDKGEFSRLAEKFAAAHAKWPTGIYMLWYPAKDRRGPERLAREIASVAAARDGGSENCLRVEFSVAPQTAESGLVSTGLLIVNPPWTLASELKTILPELEKPLGLGGAGRYRIEAVRP
jgi:23S rRNA (adenine2030-N6)-methyltransferase